MDYNPRTDIFKKISSESLTRILYSSWDIQQSLSALTFLLEECDFDARYNTIETRRFKCYETTMVISFSRPFETSRNHSALSLNTVGIKLDHSELMLKDKILGVRRKIVAHSDIDFMHFKSSVLDIEGFPFPYLQYDETLLFNPEELRLIERLLRELKFYISTFVIDLSKNNPGVLEFYKQPVARL